MFKTGDVVKFKNPDDAYAANERHTIVEIVGDRALVEFVEHAYMMDLKMTSTYLIADLELAA